MNLHTPLQVPQNMQISLDPAEWKHIRVMSDEIYKCPYRNSRGRSIEEVTRDVMSGVILEFALVRQGGKMNPKSFNVYDPDSYNWDVDWKHWRCEVKNNSFKDTTTLPENYKDKKWVSMPPWIAEKILKNRRKYPNCVDVVVLGTYNKLDDNLFDVRFEAMVPFENIHHKLKEGKRYFKNNEVRSKKDGKLLGYKYVVYPTNEPGYYASIYGE